MLTHFLMLVRISQKGLSIFLNVLIYKPYKVFRVLMIEQFQKLYIMVSTH